MNALGENRTVINKKNFLEGILRISRDRWGKAAGKWMLVLLALWVGLVVFTLKSGGTLIETLGSLVFVGLIGLWLMVYMPRHFAGQSWKAHCRIYGEETERVTRFYPDRLVVTGENLEKEVPYREILQVKASRNLLVLLCEDKSAVLLEKEGFRGVSREEILARISADR